MSTVCVLNVWVALALLAAAPPAGDDGDWVDQYERAYQQRRYQREQLEVEVERREDLMDARRERAQRRLDDARDEALQGTSGQEREALRQEFLRRQQDLDREYGRFRGRLENWSDWAEGLIRRDYKAAKDDAKYLPPEAPPYEGSYPPAVPRPYSGWRRPVQPYRFPGWRSGTYSGPGFGWYPGWRSGPYPAWREGPTPGADPDADPANPPSSDAGVEAAPDAEPADPPSRRGARRKSAAARKLKTDADKRNAGWLFRAR